MTGISVLLYHRTPRDPTERTAISTPLARFRQQMAYLRDAGYTSLTPDALLTHIESGQPRPERAVVITFDGGDADTLALVDPILERHGFCATLFLCVGLVSRDNGRFSHLAAPLTWEQARALRRFRIQCQGARQERLTKLAPAELRSTIAAARDNISYEIGVTPTHFAYPFGAYNDAVKQAVAEAGFRSGFAVHRGAATPSEDPYQIHRVTIHGDDSLETFARKVETGYGSVSEAVASYARDAIYRLPLAHQLVERHRQRVGATLVSPAHLIPGPVTNS